MKKKTLVIGASPKKERYSYLAVKSLQKAGHPFIALGRRAQTVEDWEILDGKPDFKDIDTITLYLNPANQKDYYEYIIGLKPKRVIFNPGTENRAFEELLQQQNIETEVACTLVLLSIDQY